MNDFVDFFQVRAGHRPRKQYNAIAFFNISDKGVAAKRTMKSATCPIWSKIKDSILPSVSSDGESPTYGKYMIFDLTTERGNITEGYNKMDMGIFKGDNFLTDKNVGPQNRHLF